MKQHLQREFVACMFDYDGTLIERGYRIPLSNSMAETLQQITKSTHMALCTARPFPAAIKNARNILGDHYDELKDRWVWICENGGAGYVYDHASDDYVEFYRSYWPETTMPYVKFQEIVRERFRELTHEIDFHESVAILRPKNLPTLSLKEIEDSCARLELLGVELLHELNLHHEIHLGNSGLGIIFFGKHADKDRGVREFGNLLRSRGVAVDEPFREIICFGDNPGPYGNDEQFLSGRFGTPVNVGDAIYDRDTLICVLDDDGKRLSGPSATSHLLQQLSFKKLS